MRVVFGSVIYDQRIEFIDDFVESLNKQNFLDFDIIFISDDLNDSMIDYIENKLIHKSVIFNCRGLKPYELRVDLIKQSKNRNYDLLVLGDFDDTFSDNRISSIVNEFNEEYGFLYNNLLYFNSHNLFFNDLPIHTLNIENILECNYLGLSNTSLNLKKIDNMILDELSNCKSPMFDWYMYSLFLSREIVGKKMNQGFTSYRLHSNNIAGLCNDSKEAIKREVDYKILHYSSLCKINVIFEELFFGYKNLREDIEKGLNVSKYKNKNINNFWWGNIRLNNRGEK